MESQATGIRESVSGLESRYKRAKCPILWYTVIEWPDNRLIEWKTSFQSQYLLMHGWTDAVAI
jgi:hypothetical protein